MPNGEKPITVVQFTDTHFFGDPDARLLGVDTAKSFEVIRELAAAQYGDPAFYLLTGDLSQDETHASYERFAQHISMLPAPVYYLPGNHDARGAMEASFNASEAKFDHADYFTAGNWLVVLLDTQETGKIGGRLSEEELHRLDVVLGEHPDKHALITMHHHPVPVGSRWIDKIGVENHEQFWQIVHMHRSVKGVLWGHVHQQFDGDHLGIKLMASPSTCVQFKPQSDDFAVDVVPPGFRWLKLHPDGAIETGVVRAPHVAEGLNPALKGY